MELIDHTLGEFRLKALIGEGGYGQVYRAHQAGLDREAVVKVLGIDARNNPAAVERFLREAKLASRLDHPYAAHVYAFGVAPDGLVWIAMELVRGTPLDRIIEHAPLPLERAVPLLARLCEVVQTAHDQGIVHRDLKPANVMVISRAGSMFPKLLDLGIAIDRSHIRGDDSEPIGTPFYMAPEQWTGAETGPATDVYALGAITYEVLTGVPPFVGDSAIAVAVQHARARPPRLPEDLPADLNGVISRAMAKRSAERFASALDLAAAIAEASGVGGDVVLPPRLDESIRAEAVLRAPQPIAETIAVFDSARNPHQAQLALRQLVRVCCQFVGVLALACRTRSGTGRRSDSRIAIERLRALRRGRLDALEWWELARELTRPFAEIPDAHPIPELVALFQGDADPMAMLVGALDAGGTSSDDVRRALGDAMPHLAATLRAIAFLYDYTLVVAGERCEVWMGVRPPRRSELPIDHASRDHQPLLVGADQKPVVALWPLVQAAPPTPNTPPELFLLDGTVRGAACLIAHPHGFERHDDTVWDWLAEGLGPIEGVVTTGPVEEAAPYRGLTTFQESDADTFLGREQEVATVANRLRSTPLLAIVGPSGVGKSSFVRAGVLPALRGAGPVRTLVIRPGHAPLSGLSAQLGALLGTPIEVGAIAADPDLVGTRLRELAVSTDTRITVVVDQCEELFTLCRDPAARAAYARALCGAARTAEDPVRVIVTLRDDFLVRASTLPELGDRLSSSLQVLTTPGREQLLRILVEPARRAGYEFEDGALLDEMIDAVVDRPGALALLSFTALQLWEVRDRHFRILPRKAYAAIGGVGGALGRHAEQTLAALPAEQQRLVRVAFRQLVTAEGTRAVVGERDLIAALASSATDPQVASLVIERLIEARIVVASEDDRGEQRIEIAHEAVLEAWPRLMEWQREDAEGIRFRDHLRAAAKQWEDRGRPRGMLWRGDALLEYQLWRSRAPDAPGARERAFVDASEGEANRSRRRRRAVLGGVIVAMTIVSIVLFQLRQRATASAADARRRELASLIEQGRQAATGGDSASALVYLSEAYARRAATPAVRYMLGRAHRQAAGFERAIPIEPPIENLDAANLVLSPDGSWVVVASATSVRAWDTRTGAAAAPLPTGATFPPGFGGSYVAIAEEHGVRLWNPKTGEQRVVAESVKQPFVRITGDGTRLLLVVSAGGGNTVTLWDVATDRSLAAIATQIDFRPPLLFRDGQRFAALCTDKVLRVWDFATRSQVYASPTLELSDLGNADPSERRLLTHDFTGQLTARIWDIAGAAPPIVMRGHQQAIMSGALSPDGTRVATGSRDRTVKIWDAATGDLVADLANHRGVVSSVAFSGDGRRLLSRSMDGTVYVWDAATARELAALALPDMKAAVISRDGDRVITATAHELKTWRVALPDLELELPGHSTMPVGAGVAPDGGRIAVQDRRQNIRIWDRRTGRLERELREFDLGDDSKRVFGLDMTHQRKLPAFDSTGTRLFAPIDKRIAVWDVASGARLAMLEGHTKLVSSVRFSRDGSVFISAGQDGTAIVWDAATTKPLATVREDDAPQLFHAELSPDGELAATAGNTGVTVWRWREGKKVFHVDVPMAVSAAFSADGRRIASSGRAGRLLVWSTADGRPLARVDSGATYTMAMRFTDEGLLVVLTQDGNARILDGTTLFELGRIGRAGSTGVDRWAEVTPDGKSLVLTGADPTVRVWTIALESEPPAAVAQWVRCQVPLGFVEGRIEPRAIDRRGCEDVRRPRK